MVAEEIEIIVTAKVEEALKEFEKILPAMKNIIKQAQEELANIDMAKLQKAVKQQMPLFKKQIQNLKKNIENNGISIKINNEDAEKQIAQIQKQIDALQKKITGRQLKLEVTNNALDKIRNDTNQSVIKEMPEAGNKQIMQETYKKLDDNTNYQSLVKQSDRLNNEIEKYNTLLNSAKSKMIELGQEVNKTAMNQNKLSSFFGGFKQKIEQVKPNLSGIKNSFKGLPNLTQNITNNIKGMGTGVRNGLGHILRYAGALFSMQSIYSTLSGCAQSWLSSQNAGAKQLSANIDYMKYAMGSALAPIIQWVTNLVYQLMKAIQSVAYALTGVNIFAKASANSYASMAGSAKKAKQETKQLAGVHNEINNLQSVDGSDSGNGGGTSAVPSIDFSEVSKLPNNIIDAIKNGNWYEVGAMIGQKLNEAMDSIPWEKIQDGARKIGTNIAQFLNGFIAIVDWKKVGNTFAQGINTIIYLGQSFIKTFNWKSFGNAIGDGLSSFIKNIDWKAFGDTLSNGIKGIFDTITGFFVTFDWSVVVNGLLDFITGFDWNGVSDALFEALGAACASLVNLGMVIGEKINEALDRAKEFFQEKVEECGGNVFLGILKGIGDAVIGIGQWINEHIFQPFIDGFKEAFGIHSPSTVMAEMGGYLIEGLKSGIINIVNKITDIWNQMKATAIEIFLNIKTALIDKVIQIKNGIVNILNGIKTIWNNIWTGLKTTVTNIFNGIWNVIKKVINSILGGIEGMANGVVNGVNTVIKALNRLKFDIPDWVPGMGGKTFGFNIGMIPRVSIPRLAKGGVLTEATTVLAGEYSGAKSNPEIVTPQNIMRDTFEDVLLDFNSNSSRPVHVTIQYLGKDIFDDTIEYINSKTRRTGKNTIVTVGD